MTGSLIDDAANTIATAVSQDRSGDSSRAAAVRLWDHQMLTSPERDAERADMDRIITIELLREDVNALAKQADTVESTEVQAGIRLAVTAMRKAFARLLESPAQPVTPEIWALIHGGRASETPPTALYTVKGGPDFDDMVIEVPAGITAPNDVAAYLVGRLTALTRPLIDAELYVDWMVYLGEDHPFAQKPFASLSIDGHKSVQYPLIEAPRAAGGAQ